MSPLQDTLNSTRLLGGIMLAIAACVFPMALALNPPLLTILWQDTLPLSTPSIVVLWI